MDDASILVTSSEDEEVSSKQIVYAALLAYQAIAGLVFAALPFVSDNWLNPLYLLGILFLGTGLWVFRIRSGEFSSKVFSVFTASSSIALGAGAATTSNPGIFLLWALALGATAGSLLQLTTVYSEQWNFSLKYPYITYIGYLAGSIPVLTAVANLRSFPNPAAIRLVGQIGIAYIGISIIAFLIAAVVRLLRSESPITREQNRFILWTCLLAFTPSLLWAVVNSINVLPFELHYLLALAPTMLFPLGLGFTLLRYDLVKTDYVLSQAALYASLTVMAGAAYSMIASGLSLIFSNLINVNSPFIVGVMAFVFVLALNPLRHKLQRVTDRVFYRGEDIYREQLNSYSNLINEMETVSEIGITLQKEIEKTFNPTRLHIFTQQVWTKNYVTLLNSKGEKTTDLRFAADSGLVKMLTSLSSSIYFGEGQTYPISLQADKPRMALLGAQLFVAMPGIEALSGWIAVGSKTKGERYYTEDLKYLTELCKLTGREFERAQIQADKDRREHEMNVLTRVAQGVTVTVAFDDILELIYAQTGHLLPSGDFNISLYNPDTKTLRHAFYIEKGERLSEHENRETNSNQGLESEVIRSRRAIITDDYLSACRDYGVVPTREGILSWMGVPLNAGAETIGEISIASRDPGVTYTEEQKNLLQAVADQAAGAIVKARLLEESERRARQLATLNETARNLTSTLEIDPLLNRILQSAASILNCEAGSLLLVDLETDELVFEVTAGPVADDLTGTRLAHGVGLVGQSVESRKPIIMNDVEASNSWSDETDKETGFITRDLLVVPMMVKDKVIGVIEVINKRDRSPFTPEDQELLMAFTGQAAILVENARLYAQTDQRLAARVEELSVMQRIDRELNTSLDVERAMQITLDWSFQQSATTAGLVGLIGEEGLTIVASKGFTTELDQFEGEPVPLDFPTIRAATSSGQVQSLQSETPEERTTFSAQTKSQLVIPIRRESDVIGLLVLESTQETGFDEDTQDFLMRLSNHAAIAISNAQLYSEVQKANLAKSEFVSFVAHELKTPMTSIKGYADLLAAGAVGEINDAQENFLSTIRSNVTRMSTLVTDLADISRIEAGRLHLEFATIPVGEAVEDVVHSTRALIDEKRQTLVIDIPDDLSPAWGDRNRIIQILTNLVSNAHKYTPEAGNIIIKAREADNQWEPDGADKVVHISVADSGIGIKDEDQKKIFQQYFRTEDSKDFAAGTGLGLNIARYLVEMQGGQIWFESEYRKGTTFHFTIPLTGIDSV